MKTTYFISDAHLGSWGIDHRRQQERRVVNFLDSIKHKADAIYMLGDMFDFWYEYKMVVPKGYTRFLGKISELTDMGVEVHYFTGNHDIWCGDYLEKECGVILHRKMMTFELYGKIFCISHGDELNIDQKGFRFIRSIFHNKICQTLFSALHPRWGVFFGLSWAKHSRVKHNGIEGTFDGDDKDTFALFAKDYLTSHPEINYFIFGHKHVDVDYMIADNTRFIILGDWITKFTFACFDGNELNVEHYIEGETKL